MEEKIIIALEIGSSKIKGATGAVGPDGTINVKAVERESISDIVRYGCVRNIVETAQAVQKVIERLELRESPRKIEGVYLSIGGRSLSSQAATIERRLASDTIITQEILEDIFNEALEYPLPERNVVTVTRRELYVNNALTSKPLGEIGSHILAKLNIISCRNQPLRNLTMMIEDRLGLKIMDTFVRTLAIADLVLVEEEKRLGCMLVDFGAETTTVAIFKNGVLMHLAVLPMGSRNITRDITALNYVEEQAEEMKKGGGSAFPTLESSHAPGQPDFVAINNYVSARAAEIIVNVCEQVKYAGLTPDQLSEGVIIVGKGARLSGFNQRLSQISGMKVRTGVPVSRRLRILDGRIQVADAVDVLAILNAAAKGNVKECLSPAAPAATAETVSVPAGESKPAVESAPAGTAAATAKVEPASKSTTSTGTVTSVNTHTPVMDGGRTGGNGRSRLSALYDKMRERVANAISNSFNEEDDEE